MLKVKKSQIAGIGLICLFLTPAIAHSQMWDWLPCMGPVQIGGIGVAPNGDYLVSGQQLFYRSTDHGNTWTVNRATAIQPDILFASGPITVTSAGILNAGSLTTDYGAHWTRDKNAPYLSTVEDPEGNHLYGFTQDAKIASSSDGGQSWGVFIEANQNDSMTGLIGVTSDQTLFGVRSQNELVRYDGNSWIAVSKPQQFPDVLFEISPNVLIVFLQYGGASFVSRSYNNGLSWTQPESTGLIPGSTHGSASTLLRIDTATFLALGSGGVVRSTDTARTTQLWENWPSIIGRTPTMMARDSEHSLLFSDGASLVQEDRNPRMVLGSLQTLWDFAASKWGTLYATTVTARDEEGYNAVLYQSTNRGISWFPAPETFNGEPVTGCTITVDSDGFRYLTNPRQYSSLRGFHRIPTTRINPDGIVDSLPIAGVIQLIAHPGNFLLAVTDHGSFRSTDHGDSWEATSVPSPVIVAIDNNGIMYGADSVAYDPSLGSCTHHLLRSTDLGKSWTIIRSPFADHSDYQLLSPNLLLPKLAVSRSGHLFLAVDSLGILHSTDHGDTWNQLSLGFTTNPAMFHGIGIAQDGDLFLDNQNYLYRSSDEGITWEQDDFFTTPFRSMSVTSCGTFAWTPLESFGGFLARYIKPQSQLSVSVAQPFTQQVLVSPNPFSFCTAISITLTSPQPVSIIISDPLGREIWHATQYLSSGVQKITFDGHALPEGTYFYQIRLSNEVKSGSMVIER
jgi:hypothetical protein